MKLHRKQRRKIIYIIFICKKYNGYNFNYNKLYSNTVIQIGAADKSDVAEKRSQLKPFLYLLVAYI